jgi:hypothetical protein
VLLTAGATPTKILVFGLVASAEWPKLTIARLSALLLILLTWLDLLDRLLQIWDLALWDLAETQAWARWEVPVDRNFITIIRLIQMEAEDKVEMTVCSSTCDALPCTFMTLVLR